MDRKTLTICLIGFSTLLQARAQLAITEIQTQESTNSLVSGKKGPDWWELTNYGTNTVDLTGYRWEDGAVNHPAQNADAPFNGVSIAPGESIAITESNSVVGGTNTFRQWWGIGNNVQVIVSASTHGLSATAEAVRLWSANVANSTDPNDLADLVDRVDVGAAVTNASGGFLTFVYDTNNGTFDWYSTNGVGGAFKAATSSDIGSPGIAPQSGRIVITQQPSPPNYTVPINTPVSYTVAGYGLPKPKFQWLFNGSPADTNALGATISVAITNNRSLSTLTIASVQTLNTGTYGVVASNGVQTVNCSNAVLTVTTTPSAPVITAFSPTNLTAYIGQNVTFTVDAFGSPSPGFQWKLNNTNLIGQNGTQLHVSLSNTNQTGTYTVVASNSAGSTNASGLLIVTPKPDLRITEIMSSEVPGGGHNDWWELSNLGTFSVNLLGYRFDDESFLLADAYTITNNTTIAPGESIVLAENMTPDEFRTWWGPENLPPNLQIIDYNGSGLSFSGTQGDALTVWNAAAVTEGDFIDSVTIAAETNGISFCYDPYGQTFPGIVPDGLSVSGVNGAFAADVNGDIGSPGTIVNFPKFTGITATSGGIQISWISQSNFTYTVQFKTNLTDAGWTTLTNVIPTASQWNYVDPMTGTRRFYRVFLNITN